MSVQSLYTAATGMEAMEHKLDVIANNIANIGTIGFKKDRANFEDLFYRYQAVPGSEQVEPSTGVGIQTGVGTRVSSVQTNFRQGSMEETNRALDVAIEGEGFLQVVGPNGEQQYTRSGNLSINRDGTLVVGSANVGRRIEPQITLPQNVTSIQITSDGVLSVLQEGQTEFTPVQTLQLARFPNPEGLLKLGDNLYGISDASGQATINNPGQPGFGLLRQGYLEASNVEPVRELIDLIQAQRNIELNSKIVQAGDETLSLISGLRR
ncbi:MAG: flagellar basal-body rod protein FlgG [Planctomycetaceae bacterium]|nr:flagellar basal-body rod protein FlgG [Planctomycetaceae bacterium]